MEIVRDIRNQHTHEELANTAGWRIRCINRPPTMAPSAINISATRIGATGSPWAIGVFPAPPGSSAPDEKENAFEKTIEGAMSARIFGTMLI
jgi:hypothetical protein